MFTDFVNTEMGESTIEHWSSGEEEQYGVPLDSENLGLRFIQPIEEHNGTLFVDMNSEVDRSLVQEPSGLAQTNYSGSHDFTVSVDPNTLNTSFSFLEDINTIYVMPEREFPLDFKIKDYPANEKLYIRVTLVFPLEDIQKQVTTCPKHTINNQEPEFMNMLRCTDKDALYFGDGVDKKLNILFPVERPTPSLKSMRRYFTFLCLSSCHNTKNICSIFTLENVTGFVLGRGVFLVKVAKNISRDKHADEHKLRANRNMSSMTSRRQSKRRRVQSNSDGDENMDIYPHIFSMMLPEDLDKIHDYMRSVIFSKIKKCGGFGTPDSSPYAEIITLIPSKKWNIH